MPALKNVRHENFCQLTIQGAKFGWTQADIYKRAGYRASGHSAEMAASRLMKKDEIRVRIAELTAPAARKAQVTAASLVEELDDIKQLAKEEKQLGAAHAAVSTKAKITGHLREKLEIGGVGEFDDCSSPQAIVDKWVNTTEGGAQAVLDMIDAARARVVERAGDAARPVNEPAERRPRKSSEASMALALLRPGRRIIN